MSGSNKAIATWPGGPAFRVLCEGWGCSLITEKVWELLIYLHALGIEAVSAVPRIALHHAESGSKSLQYWSTGNGDDTMVTLWNPADEAQDFTITLFFALPDGSRGHYLWPQHLEARATRTFNVSEIVQNQIPDSEGNTIPAVVHEGGIKIAGSQAENQHILIVVEAGIYNVRKATCGGSCQQCNGIPPPASSRTHLASL